MNGASISWWSGRERECLLALNSARAQFTRDLILKARHYAHQMPEDQKQSIVLRYEDKSKQANSAFLTDLKELQRHKQIITGDGKASFSLEEKIEILMNPLRSDEVFQIAQFYYELDETDQANPKRMRPFLLRHNAYLAELASDPKKCVAMGIRRDRVEEGILSETEIEKVMFNLKRVDEAGPVRYRAVFDQTVLAKLFVDIMSIEQNRLNIILLGDFVFLDRYKLSLSLVQVISRGVLEDCFRSFLNKLLTDFDVLQRDRGAPTDVKVREEA